MAVLYSPWGNNQFFDANGAPANGWKIYTYVAGSSTPLSTYTDSTGTVAQSNPIVINSLGFPTTGQIWLTSGLSYKLVLTDASDVVKKTQDNLSGVLSSSSSTLSQWVASGLTPTYVSATSFTLAGDQTSAFHVGRRLQTTNTSGTIYSRIVTSAYGALTTVTVVNDSGVLDSGLSAVNYSLLTATGTSTPGAASPVLPRIDVASVAGTVDLTGNATIDDIRITGTNAITAFTVATGRVLRVTAGGTFTLTNNGSIVTQTGSNIICASGDTFMIRATAANVVEILNYSSVNNSSTQIQPISASVAANAMTVTASALALDFRSTTLTSGTITRVVGTPSSLVVPSGATLGSTSALLARYVVIALNNAGTIELAVVNQAGGNDLSEIGLISTTAISAGATSASVIYSTTARTNVSYRVIGIIEATEATAGTWATAPSLIQGSGGFVNIAKMSYVQFPSIATTSGTTADQTGIPSWARRITVFLRATSTNGTSAKQLQIGSGSVVTTGYASSASGAYSGNTISSVTSSTGFILGISSIAANTEYCQIFLMNMGNNVWQYVSNTSMTTSQGACFTGGGEISLSGSLDRVRLTTVNGTDTYDNGAMIVLVEG